MDLTTHDADREQLKVVDAEYTVESGHKVAQPVVHLFCRDRDRNRRRIGVEGFRPYFKIAHDEFVERTRDVINDRHVIAVDADLSQYDDVPDEIDGDDPDAIADWLTAEANETLVSHSTDVSDALDGTPLVTVYTIEPSHVGKIRDYWDKTWEADVPFPRRFLIDSNVYLGCEVPAGAERVRYENWNGHSDAAGQVTEITACDAPDIDPRMMVVDIEVYAGDNGFPDPIEATQPITSITAYDNYTEQYAVWILENESWETEHDFESDITAQLGTDIAQLSVFDHEGSMVEDFHQWVLDKDFDVMTAWNAKFDYPYIANRSYEISAYSIREWTMFDTNPGAWRDQNDNIQATMDGRVVWDALEAYKKTQYRELTSYKLEDVAQAELGMGKEEMDDIDEAWETDPVQFLTYNVRDVQAVVEIEQQSALLDLYDNMRQVTGALYNTCHHNGPMLDTLFLRQAHQAGISLTTNYEPDQGDYHGAHVFDPVPGKHENVVYPDLASLYPYILWSLNISPETMYETKAAYRADGYDDSDVFTAYIDNRDWYTVSSGDTIELSDIDEDQYKGVHDETGRRKKKTSQGFDGIFDPQFHEIYFLKPDVQEGFIRQTVDLLVDLKYRYKGQGDMYAAVKRVTNSVYGVLGDSASGGKGFRLFDWKMAEAITLGGQKVIQYTAEQYVDLINQYSQESGYEPNSYLVGGDTDSVQTAIPQAPDYQTALNWAQCASEEFQEGLYDKFMHEQFGIVPGEDEHKMDVEIESLASALFFVNDFDQDDNVAVKKRYAQHMLWEDDDGWLDTEYEEPEDPDDLSALKYQGNVSLDDYEPGSVLHEWGEPTDHIGIKGFEYVRSDSAIVTKQAQLNVLTYILLADSPSDKLYEYLTGLKEDIYQNNFDVANLGRPKGISNDLDEYGWKSTEELEADTNYTVTETDREHGGRYVSTPSPAYRGAKYADDHFEWEDIGSGDKPVRFYIEKVRGDEYPAAYEYESYPKDETRPDPLEVGRRVDAIAVNNPDQIPDDFVMDMDKMVHKELEDKVQPILRTIGEDWDGLVGEGRQVGLGDFM